MSLWWVVFRKEFVDAFRDRRALWSLLIFPLIGPLMVTLMLDQALEQAGPSERPELPVAGQEHAPALVAYLEAHDVKVVKAPADPLQAVRDRDVDAVLVIPPNFAKQYRASVPADLELLVDTSRNEVLSRLRRVQQLLQAHGQSVGALRLLTRGIDPNIAQPFRVQKVDVSTPRGRAALLLNMIPMFVLLASFIGGMYTATDVSAGERERGSLEPLLITPVARRTLVLGKWLAAVAFSGATVLLTLLTTSLALARLPADDLGMSLTLTPGDAALVLLAVLPLSFAATAAQLLVASFARSFKEAQTYLSLMMFLPMFPAILLSVKPLKTELWMSLVPVLGQQALLGDIMRDEPVSMLAFAITAALALLLGVACALLTGALLKRERIIFGRA